MVSRVGVPQPSWTMGPNRKRPGAGGKIACRSLTICGALRIGSWGKRTEPSEPLRRPARRVSTATVRLTPTSPPTPLRVKP